VRLGLYKRIAAAAARRRSMSSPRRSMTASGPATCGAESVEDRKLKLTAARSATSLRPRSSGRLRLVEERNTLDPRLCAHDQKTRANIGSKARSNCACPTLPTEEARFEFAGELMKRLGRKPRRA